MLFAAATLCVDRVSAGDTASAVSFGLATKTPPPFWATAAAEVGRERATGTRQRFLAVVWATVLANTVRHLVAAQQPTQTFVLDELFGCCCSSVQAAERPDGKD
jgi:hypothetical protein